LPLEVGAETAEKARDFMLQYLVAHARAIYAEFFRHDKQVSLLQELGDIVLTNDDREKISRRDIKQRSRRGLAKEGDDVIDRLMQQLQGMNWVGERVEPKKGSVIWAINPRVHEVFAARAERAKTEKEERHRRLEEAVATVRYYSATP
jgi:hypothetical protein